MDVTRAQKSPISVAFTVTEDPEGSYIARGVDEAIFTQGETLDDLRENMRKAAQCFYG